MPREEMLRPLKHSVWERKYSVIITEIWIISGATLAHLTILMWHVCTGRKVIKKASRLTQLSKSELTYVFAIWKVCLSVGWKKDGNISLSVLESWQPTKMLQPTKMSAWAMLQINTAVDFLDTQYIRSSVTYRLANKPNKIMMFVESRTRYWIYLNAKCLWKYVSMVFICKSTKLNRFPLMKQEKKVI